MNNFEIPKEIKAKPKIMGLEVKEIVIILLVVFGSMTFLKDMIHKYFVIPYYIVVALGLLYSFSNSLHNPKKKNYESIILLFKRDKKIYHAIDKNKTSNEELLEEINEINKPIIDRFNSRQAVNDRGIEESLELATNHEEQEEKDLLRFEESNKVIKNVIKKEKEKDKQSIKYNGSSVNSDESSGNQEKEVESVKKKSAKKMISLPSRSKSDKKEHVMEDKLQENKHMEEMEVDLTQGNLSRSEHRNRPPKNYSKYALIALSILLFSVGSWYLSKGQSQDAGTVAKEEVGTEDALVNALKKFSMKEYEEASSLFDEIEYSSLDDDDKDLMLLSYLFSDQPEKAIQLEPAFDESVIGYYKARHSMQKIKDLSEVVDSKAIDFEVAANEKDYWSVIELKESVKMKGERPQIIIDAYLKLENAEGAIKFASSLDDESLLKYAEEESKELEKDNKNKKK